MIYGITETVIGKSSIISMLIYIVYNVKCVYNVLLVVLDAAQKHYLSFIYSLYIID